MKFAVKAWGNGKARTGFLQLVHCASAMETPALLLSTRKGLPNFSSPDLLPSLPSPDSHLLQFSPLHLGICHIRKRTKLLANGCRASVARDSVQCLPKCDATNKFGASFETTRGHRSTGGAVFGAIVGGNDVEERQDVLRSLNKQFLVGYWIGGFGLGESTDERPALLDAITVRILLVMLSGCFTRGNAPHDCGLDFRHNTHHYLGFFRSIREAIKAGKFQQFHQKFVEVRRNHLALATLALGS
ncbi:hypothetical protein SDJN02_20985, partial [Cucurbita argyrosperma subsp. argyrosperma]